MKIMKMFACDRDILNKLILGTAYISTLQLTIHCTYRKWRNGMGTYVLWEWLCVKILNQYQSLVNNSVFVVKLIPSMIEISQNTIINTFYKTLHQGSYTRIALTCTREWAVHTSFRTTFLTNEHRKNTHKSHNFSA